MARGDGQDVAGSRVLWVHRRRAEAGFTIVELMVVLLIIGVLIAVALPTYLGARQRAYNRDALSDLRNAFPAARVVYGDIQDYAAVPAATLRTMLHDAEPALEFVAGNVASSSANDYSISVRVFQYAAVIDPDYSELNLAVRSKSGECYYLRDIPEPSDVGDTPGDWRGHRSQGVMANCTGDAVALFATNSFNFNGWD